MKNVIKISELVEFVKDQESELAYGSETCLWGEFYGEYRDFCMMSKSELEECEETVASETFDLWQDAYVKYRDLENAGVDFNVSDCF